MSSESIERAKRIMADENVQFLNMQFTDIVGGRSGKYEEVLARARREAISEMKQEALQLGGNAVIGVDIDYEVLGSNGSMLMVSVSGTAVVI